MDILIAVLTIGLAYGALYALIALGYTMVYGVIELINFAHGDVFMVGAFISLGPLRNAPRLAPLVTAIGVSFILQSVVRLWQSDSDHAYPPLINTGTFLIANTTVNTNVFIVLGAAVFLMLALDLFINRTRIGRAMRAIAQDSEAATMMGVDVDRTIAITFFIGSALAGAAGVVYGIYVQSISYNIGFIAGLVAFTAAVLGGIGNIRGAMLGGLLIGMLQTFVSQQFGGNGAVWAEPAVFAVLILVLVLRPTGLLGAQVVEKA